MTDLTLASQVMQLTFQLFVVTSPLGNMYTSEAPPPKQTQVKYIEEREEPRFGGGGVVAHAVIDEPRMGHEQGERYSDL